MTDDSRKEGFYSALTHHLVSCGYSSHGEGVFTKGEHGLPTDWFSVTGNRYFYMVNGGVVFPDISAQLRDALPVLTGMAPLDNIPASLLPFVFSPGGHYVRLPSRAQNPSVSSALTVEDARELAEVACGPLLEALSDFHDLPAAIQEVERTLETGGAKAFLLVLAHIKQGEPEAAMKFAQRALAAFKTETSRNFYGVFLKNIESLYGLNLR